MWFAAKQGNHDFAHKIAAFGFVVLNLKIGFLASLGNEANAHQPGTDKIGVLGVDENF